MLLELMQKFLLRQVFNFQYFLVWQQFIVAFVGVATWFRNGTATNPRPLGPSARRHQCGGRQMAFIDG